MPPAPAFEVHEANLHGHRAVYRTIGSGPTVVLIHGMINSSRHWETVAQRLAGSHRVIAPDLIGHGEAATPRGDYSLGAHAASIRDLLAVIGVDHATIVRNNMIPVDSRAQSGASQRWGAVCAQVLVLRDDQ